MMERKRILDEGLLEKYLLDELSIAERTVVETALQEDAELKKHFEQLEADFERMAFENAINPDSRIKEALKEQIAEKKQPYRQYFLVAAGLALLFSLTTFWMYDKWQSAQENLNLIEIQTSSLEERLETLEENYQLTNSRLELINSPSTIPFVLNSNEKIPNSRAVAYVNHEDRSVIVNSVALPQLPKDKTYQMWSDVDGEMINMGLLEPSEELIAVKYIDRAESLNITIEPAGGNDHATVENLVSQVIL